MPVIPRRLLNYPRTPRRQRFWLDGSALRVRGKKAPLREERVEGVGGVTRRSWIPVHPLLAPSQHPQHALRVIR